MSLANIDFTLLMITLLANFQMRTTAIDCRSTLSGGEYTGNISVTKSGKQCQRWDVQSPHTHGVSADYLPDKTLSDASNYCRNPTFEHEGPWCYVDDPNVTWERCDIPVCRKYSYLCWCYIMVCDKYGCYFSVIFLYLICVATTKV